MVLMFYGTEPQKNVHMLIKTLAYALQTDRAEWFQLSVL